MNEIEGQIVQQQHSTTSNLDSSLLLSTDGITKFEEVGEGIIDLCNEGPIDRCMEMLAEKVMVPFFWEGASQFVAHPSPIGGHSSVRNILCQHIRHFFGVSHLRWDQLLLIQNECAALELFVRCYCEPNDVLLSPAPFADPNLPNAIAAGSSHVHLLPIQLKDEPELSIADLQEAVDRLKKEGRRVRAVLLHNPHPILSWIGDGQRRLAHILKWAAERKIFLLVDESLGAMDLWEFSSCLDLEHRDDEACQWLVWIWSAEKHFSLPGLQFSALILPRSSSPSEHHIPITSTSTITSTSSPISSFLQLHSCAPLVQFLTAKLLMDFEWTSEMFAKRKTRLGRLRELIIEGLNDLGLMRTLIAPEEPTPWIMADLKMFLAEPNFESERKLRDELAEKASLWLNSGEQLGMAEPGWFRLRVASSENKIIDVLNGLKMVLAGRKGSLRKREGMDLSKYGGTMVGKAEEGTNNIKKEMKMGKMEEEEVQNMKRARELEEQMEEERMEVGEWEGGRRNGKEEEETEGCGECRTEEIEQHQQLEEADDNGDGEDILREVFAIFPKDQLRWREPLVMREEERWKSLKGREERKRRGIESAEGSQNEGNEQMMMGMEKGKDVQNELNGKKEGNNNGNEEVMKVGEEKTTIAMLTDLSFIEGLVCKQQKVKGEILEEGQFYDEVGTEEEKKEEDESSRIIEIIDQIFQEAVQIREYTDDPIVRPPPPSTSSSRKGDNNINSNIEPLANDHFHPRSSDSEKQSQHQPPSQQFWSRPDSGLAESAGSPTSDLLPSSTLSPTIVTIDGQPIQQHSSNFLGRSVDNYLNQDIGQQQHKQQQRCFWFGTVNSADAVDDTIRSRDSAFHSDTNSPTETLIKSVGRSKWMMEEEFDEEEEKEDEMHRHRGMTAQMLDDSGIFVDLPPGSLSIDFPLLIQKEQFQEVKWMDDHQMEEELEEEEKEDEKIVKMDDMHLKRGKRKETFTEEELYELIGRKEEDNVGGKAMVDEKPRLEWLPMEDVGPEATWVEVDPDKEAEEEAKLRKHFWEEGIALSSSQQQLTALINEGSTFCSAKLERGSEISRIELNGEEEEEQIGWRPMEQLNEEEMKMEEMEEEERGRGREEEEAADVVAGWNVSVGERMLSSRRKNSRKEEDEVGLDVHLIDLCRTERGEWSEVRWEESADYGVEEKIQKQQKRGEVGGRTVIEVNITEEEEKNGEEDDDELKWRDRWRKPELERHCRIDQSFGQRKVENSNDSDDVENNRQPYVNIQGGSRYFQVHQRMQMGRRLGNTEGKAISQEAVILEHMNITELEYKGPSGMEEVRTSISTRINRWAEDEWFRKIPTEEWIEMEETMAEEKMREGRNWPQSHSLSAIFGDGREKDGEEKEKSDGHRQNGKATRKVTTEMNENEYKKMKRARERRALRRGEEHLQSKQRTELHSEFETTHYETWPDGMAKSIGRTRHKLQRPTKLPSRITVRTNGGRTDGMDTVDRVTVRHTPGSRWIVSSVCRSTDWGWEKTMLR